jgi:hypothetical protein
MLMMKQMGFIDGQTRPCTEAMNAYDNVFVDQLNLSHAEVIRQLFPDPQEERPRRRAR